MVFTSSSPEPKPKRGSCRMEVYTTDQDEVVWKNDDGREFYFNEKEATALAVELSNAAVHIRVKHQRKRAELREKKKNGIRG